MLKVTQLQEAPPGLHPRSSSFFSYTPLSDDIDGGGGEKIDFRDGERLMLMQLGDEDQHRRM